MDKYVQDVNTDDMVMYALKIGSEKTNLKFFESTLNVDLNAELRSVNSDSGRAAVSDSPQSRSSKSQLETFSFTCSFGCEADQRPFTMTKAYSILSDETFSAYDDVGKQADYDWGNICKQGGGIETFFGDPECELEN